MIDMSEVNYEYHPYAKIKGYSVLNNLKTFDGFKTMEKALDQIALWASSEHLVSAYVMVVCNHNWDTAEKVRVF